MFFEEKNEIYVISEPDGQTFTVYQDDIAWQSWRTYEGTSTEIAKFKIRNKSWEVKTN